MNLLSFVSAESDINVTSTAEIGAASDNIRDVCISIVVCASDIADTTAAVMIPESTSPPQLLY